MAVGTALLRSSESGASALHRAALVDPSRAGTVVTIAEILVALSAGG